MLRQERPPAARHPRELNHQRCAWDTPCRRKSGIRQYPDRCRGEYCAAGAALARNHATANSPYQSERQDGRSEKSAARSNGGYDADSANRAQCDRPARCFAKKSSRLATSGGPPEAGGGTAARSARRNCRAAGRVVCRNAGKPRHHDQSRWRGWRDSDSAPCRLLRHRRTGASRLRHQRHNGAEQALKDVRTSSGGRQSPPQ